MRLVIAGGGPNRADVGGEFGVGRASDVVPSRAAPQPRPCWLPRAGRLPLAPPCEVSISAAFADRFPFVRRGQKGAGHRCLPGSLFRSSAAFHHRHPYSSRACGRPHTERKSPSAGLGFDEFQECRSNRGMEVTGFSRRTTPAVDVLPERRPPSSLRAQILSSGFATAGRKPGPPRPPVIAFPRDRIIHST